MSKIAAATAGPPAADHRVITPPLAAFLLAVVAVLAWAGWARWRTPAAAEAIVELADGDLDGAERARFLRHLVAAAARSEAVPERWAGLLAAVALGDRPAHAALWAGLQGVALPAAADRALLHLGDPLLANVWRALVAEHEGRRPDAREAWQQVAAQCGLVDSPFAAELAGAALARLR